MLNDVGWALKDYTGRKIVNVCQFWNFVLSVSLDNFAAPIVCIVSGYLQQAIGPKIVSFDLYNVQGTLRKVSHLSKSLVYSNYFGFANQL